MTALIFPPPGSKELRIAWNNLFTSADATVTTDSEATGYEYEQALNWQPFNFWTPATTGSHYIQAVFAVAQPVNYVAFYAHTLGTNAATVSLEYSTNGGASWLVATTINPTGTGPVYRTFAQISAARWRFVVNSTPVSLVGVVSFGLDMTLPHGCWDGFSPPVFARDTKLTNAMSETGVFLGRSIVSNGAESALDLDKIETSWMRANWLPFIAHAERRPWFLLWNSVDYPAEAAFCWTDGNIDKPKIEKTIFMGTKLKFRCRID